MSDIPAELKYTRTDEWVLPGDDGVVTVGITDFAQQQLGDMVYVELPEPGTVIDAGGECGVVESVKTASDLYMPVAGEITAANAVLADEPEKINTDPYGDGWIYKFRPADMAALDTLLDAAAYQAKLDAEDH